MPHMHLGDKIVTLLNPCPEITERELGERMDLMRPGGDEQAFPIRVKWSSGSEGEEVELGPGESRQLAQPIAKELEKQYRHRGLVIVEAHRDELEARVHGLTNAIAFFRERGIDSIVDIQAQRAWTDDQVRKMKDSGLRSQHLNHAREQALTEELERLRGERSAKKAAKTKAAA